MPKYEFESTLFKNSRELAQAVAGEWLSADGMNSREDMLGFLAGMTDEQMADEAIEGFGLDQASDRGGVDGDDESPKTWMEEQEVTRAMLVEAFNDLRRNFETIFPAEDRDAEA